MQRVTVISFLCMLSLGLIGLLTGCQNVQGNDLATLRVTGGQFQLPMNATFVAFKGGNYEPWTQLSPSETGVYTATVTDPYRRYGFLVVEEGEPPEITCYQGVTWEAATIRHYLRRTEPPPTANTLSGTLSGMGSIPCYQLSWGNARYYQAGGTSYDFAEVTLPDGDYDLIAALHPDGFDAAPNKLVINRNVAVNGATNVPIDFTQGITPGSAEVTTAGAASAEVYLQSAGQTLVSLGKSSDGSSFSYATLPADAMLSGDRYLLLATNALGSWYKSSFRTAGAKTVDLTTIPPFENAVVNGRTLAWKPYAGADLYLFMPFQDGGPRWRIILTKSCLFGATAYTVPTVSGLPGWQPSWNLDTISGLYPGAVITSNNNTDAIFAMLQNDFSTGTALTFVVAPSDHLLTRGAKDPGSADFFPRFGRAMMRKAQGHRSGTVPIPLNFISRCSASFAPKGHAASSHGWSAAEPVEPVP